MTKLHIDLRQGIVEVEGELEFVDKVYQDYKERLSKQVIEEKVTDKPATPIDNQSDIAKNSAGPKKSVKSKVKTKESFSIVKDLDLSAKNGKESLRDFYSKKNPSVGMENNVVFVYYLQKIAGITSISQSHIYSCYKDVGTRVPNALRQSLADTAHRKGWIDTSSFENIIVTTPGENFIEQDLPRKASATTK